MIGVGGTHRWIPIGGGWLEDSEDALVIEVCPVCRQYVEVAYTRWGPTPEATG